MIIIFCRLAVRFYCDFFFYFFKINPLIIYHLNGLTWTSVVYCRLELFEKVGRHNKPKFDKLVFSLSNQTLDACLRPYTALFTMRTYFLYCVEPLGFCIYNSSYNSPFNKALLTSNYMMLQFFYSTIVRIIMTGTGFTIGENDSLKSKPCCCVYPLATNLALYQEIVSSGSSLIYKSIYNPL